MNCVTCRCPLQILNGDHLRAKCVRCAAIPFKRGAKAVYRAPRVPRVTDPSLKRVSEFMSKEDRV